MFDNAGGEKHQHTAHTVHLRYCFQLQSWGLKSMCFSRFTEQIPRRWKTFYQVHFALSPPGVAIASCLLSFPSCRLHSRPRGPAEVQHRVHPVHAWGPQHAPHLRLDGQNPGLPSPQPPAQVLAKVHQWMPPPALTQSGCPSSSQSSSMARHHNPQRRPPRWEGAPERRAHLPHDWWQGETSTGNAGDVEALVNRWIDDHGCLLC